MKKIILAVLLAMTCTLSGAEVNLNIDYNVDGVPFEYNKEYINADGIKYKVTRFEFYMCQFKLDGIELEGTYVLANAQYNKHTLGNFDIDQVNKFGISFGVEAEENIDKDPNRFGMFHPLAPKNPSMHWGWAAGYRFWAIEGFADPDGDGEYDKSFQFHILGDEAFRSVVLEVGAQANKSVVKVGTQSEDGVIDIKMGFDIQKLLAPVDMTKFGIYHEFYNNSQEIRDVINNFTESNIVTTETKSSVAMFNSIEITPNPTSDYLNIGNEFITANYDIISLEGTTVQSGNIDNDIIKVGDIATGTYILRIYDKNNVLNTAKFVKK